MQNLAIAGDWHGILNAVTRGFLYAESRRVDAIIHLGDFGYQFTDEFMAHLVKMVETTDTPIFFIRGNHDNKDFLDSHMKSPYTPVEIAPGVTYMPDGSVMDFGNTTIAALGGAYSVDRMHRVLGESWWLEEEPTFAAVEHLIETGAKADVMITHDLPYNAVNVNKYHQILEAVPSRRMVQDAIDAVRPRIVFNGHQHIRVTQDVRFTGEWDQTFRLETLDKYDGTDFEVISDNIVCFDTGTHIITHR